MNEAEASQITFQVQDVTSILAAIHSDIMAGHENADMWYRQLGWHLPRLDCVVSNLRDLLGTQNPGSARQWEPPGQPLTQVSDAPQPPFNNCRACARSGVGACDDFPLCQD